MREFLNVPLMWRRPRPHAGGVEPDVVDVRARGDVEPPGVGVTEPHVRGTDLLPRLSRRFWKPKRAEALAFW
jgi:hypothetical protein